THWEPAEGRKAVVNHKTHRIQTFTSCWSKLESKKQKGVAIMLSERLARHVQGDATEVIKHTDPTDGELGTGIKLVLRFHRRTQYIIGFFIPPKSQHNDPYIDPTRSKILDWLKEVWSLANPSHEDGLTFPLRQPVEKNDFHYISNASLGIV
ncbi:hypothetical protein GGI12_004709, partial [Dipsacomyces acuminosporus]